MVKVLLQKKILSKLKNIINNIKNDKILARLNTITVKKQVILLISILIKREKTSFNHNNFFINIFR